LLDPFLSEQKEEFVALSVEFEAWEDHRAAQAIAILIVGEWAGSAVVELRIDFAEPRNRV
jgi:hypothetical protein